MRDKPPSRDFKKPVPKGARPEGPPSRRDDALPRREDSGRRGDSSGPRREDSGRRRDFDPRGEPGPRRDAGPRREAPIQRRDDSGNRRDSAPGGDSGPRRESSGPRRDEGGRREPNQRRDAGPRKDAPRRPSPPAAKQPERPHEEARSGPPDDTFQEAQYLKTLVANKTPVRVKLLDNQEFEGVVEYYDANFIRVTRDGEANLFIYKRDIKYVEE